MRAAAIDFEYTDGGLAHPKLVCACMEVDGRVERYWLYNGAETERLKARLMELKPDTVFVAHAVEKAEGMCFIQLGLKDLDFRWYDTLLIEHMVTNVAKSGHIPLALVDVLSRRGILKEDTEATKAGKDEMRRIIIEKDDIEGHKWAILDYCSSDIHYLRQLMVAQMDDLKRILESPSKVAVAGRIPERAIDVALDYSHNAWLFALIDANGIPLQTDEVQKFLRGSASGAFRLKEEFNANVGRIYEFKTAKRKGKTTTKATAKMVLIQQLISDIVAKNNIANWPRSEKTQKWSLKDEVLKNYEHLDERIAKLRQHKKIDKMLSSFTRSGDANWLSSYSAEEGRVFAYHGFGATQTYRNAASPKTGFVPLWSRAMRTLMMPPKGKALIACDYSSEEFILGMDLYNDSVGVDAYKMGDIYIATGVKLGLLPPGAKKGDILPGGERVKDIRQRVKGLVLGLGYGMGPKSLSVRIGVSEDEAKSLVAAYKALYHATFDTQKQIKKTLKDEQRYLMLPNGYTILARGATGRSREDGTETNATLSSINWPVQSAGAFILQEIVKRCFTAGLKIITTVHDEVVIEADADKAEESARQLSEIMVDSYESLTGTRNIRTGEPEIWGEFNGKRCDHNEDGNKAYNELLALVSKDIEDDVDYESKVGSLYIDDINDNN